MLEQTAARHEQYAPTKTSSAGTGAELARSITRAGSKQTYLVARLLVDRDLRDDCCRAYAYFRWADDVIDVTANSPEERVTFINRQLAIIQGLYKGEQFDSLLPEEEMLADLICRDRSKTSGLHSFIHNFIALLEFDAQRKGQLISQDELDWYSESLSRAVTDGIQYFIGQNHPYPKTEGQYKAVVAAHITHMLRDMLEDISNGYINVPLEYLTKHDLDRVRHTSDSMRRWIQTRVNLARQYFDEGKQYLDQLDVLRCKLAGYWYCARYERVLHTIEGKGFSLQEEYKYGFVTLLKIIWLGLSVTTKHVFRRALISLWYQAEP